jgi:hypothetical protein
MEECDRAYTPIQAHSEEGAEYCYFGFAFKGVEKWPESSRRYLNLEAAASCKGRPSRADFGPFLPEQGLGGVLLAAMANPDDLIPAPRLSIWWLRVLRFQRLESGPPRSSDLKRRREKKSTVGMCFVSTKTWGVRDPGVR